MNIEGLPTVYDFVNLRYDRLLGLVCCRKKQEYLRAIFQPSFACLIAIIAIHRHDYSESFSIFATVKALDISRLPLADIFDESVIAFILVGKSGQFHDTRESSTLITLYGNFLSGFSIWVWGNVYLVSGCPEPPSDRRLLHTFYLGDCVVFTERPCLLEKEKVSRHMNIRKQKLSCLSKRISSFMTFPPLRMAERTTGDYLEQ